MKTTVVSKEYRALHQSIQDLQKEWKKELNPEAVQPKLDKAALQAGIPVVSLTSFQFDFPLYIKWVKELAKFLYPNSQSSSSSEQIVNSIMNEETAKSWIEAAISCNHIYFHEFAEKNQIDEWFPPFVAEMAVRPYLQVLAEKVQSQVDDWLPGSGCPVCGEPVRLSQLEGEGKKVVHCPRCLFHWNVNRLTCCHCGNKNHETIRFLTIEEDPASQIQVCEECHGYTKMIDTRQYLAKPESYMLDLTTLHLDFIAQENGYLAAVEKKDLNKN
jgi:FdhE protein